MLINGTWWSVFVSNVRARALVRHINHAPWSMGQKAQQNLSEGKAKQGSDRKNRRKQEGRGQFLLRKRQGKKHRRGSNTRQIVRNKNKIMRETRSWQDRKICKKGKPNKSTKCRKKKVRQKRTRGKRLSVICKRRRRRRRKRRRICRKEKDQDRAGGFMLQVFRMFSNFEVQFSMCYNIFRFPRATKIWRLHACTTF